MCLAPYLEGCLAQGAPFFFIATVNTNKRAFTAPSSSCRLWICLDASACQQAPVKAFKTSAPLLFASTNQRLIRAGCRPSEKSAHVMITVQGKSGRWDSNPAQMWFPAVPLTHQAVAGTAQQPPLKTQHPPWQSQLAKLIMLPDVSEEAHAFTASSSSCRLWICLDASACQHAHEKACILQNIGTVCMLLFQKQHEITCQGLASFDNFDSLPGNRQVGAVAVPRVPLKSQHPPLAVEAVSVGRTVVEAHALAFAAASSSCRPSVSFDASTCGQSS